MKTTQTIEKECIICDFCPDEHVLTNAVAEWDWNYLCKGCGKHICINHRWSFTPNIKLCPDCKEKVKDIIKEIENEDKSHRQKIRNFEVMLRERLK